MKSGPAEQLRIRTVVNLLVRNDWLTRVSAERAVFLRGLHPGFDPLPSLLGHPTADDPQAQGKEADPAD